MAHLIAKKHFTYNSRRLVPGQDFHTKTNRDAKILTAIGKAGPRPPKQEPDQNMLASLRARYQSKFGKKPYHGWGEDVLTSKLAADEGAE